MSDEDAFRARIDAWNEEMFARLRVLILLPCSREDMLSQRRDPENDPERLVINCTDGVPVGLSQTPEATAVMVRLVEQATEAMLHDPETGALEVLRQFARRLHARPGTFETEERVQLLPGVLYFYLCHPFEELEPELFENLFIAGR